MKFRKNGYCSFCASKGHSGRRVFWLALKTPFDSTDKRTTYRCSACMTEEAPIHQAAGRIVKRD